MGGGRNEGSRLDQHIPVLVAVVLRIPWNRAQLLAVAAKHLWIERVLPAAAITEGLHYRIDLCLKDFGKLMNKKPPELTANS